MVRTLHRGRHWKCNRSIRIKIWNALRNPLWQWEKYALYLFTPVLSNVPVCVLLLLLLLLLLYNKEGRMVGRGWKEVVLAWLWLNTNIFVERLCERWKFFSQIKYLFIVIIPCSLVMMVGGFSKNSSRQSREFDQKNRCLIQIFWSPPKRLYVSTELYPVWR